MPDDLETSDRYLAIPHKNELDLGTDLALRFAAKAIPAECRTIQAIFHHRGAYARFKSLLARFGLLDKWYEFESESTEAALQKWCTENGVEITDDRNGSSA